MANKHISLNENDFKTLVSGGVVEQDGVTITLDDIGNKVMVSAILIDSYQRGYNNGAHAAASDILG